MQGEPEGKSRATGDPGAPRAGRGGHRHDRAALDAIPWRERLSTQLLGVAAALVVGSVVVFAVVEMAIARQRLAGVMASTVLLSETISASIRHSMMKDERGEAYAIIDNIGRQGQIDARPALQQGRAHHLLHRARRAGNARRQEGRGLPRLPRGEREPDRPGRRAPGPDLRGAPRARALHGDPLPLRAGLHHQRLPCPPAGAGGRGRARRGRVAGVRRSRPVGLPAHQRCSSPRSSPCCSPPSSGTW